LGGAAFDDKKGIVFVNTGNPHPSTYGVNRPGDNKNSASVIAIDVNKQKVIWSFQETSHDLWDFDIPFFFFFFFSLFVSHEAQKVLLW
jgi:quinoprotein glucose dehydrogenase